MTSVFENQDLEVIELDYQFDEPAEKLWRALTTPDLREQWLPGDDLHILETVSLEPGRSVSYRMRETGPVSGESIVTFRVEAISTRRTRLLICHERIDLNFMRLKTQASNCNFKAILQAA
jgi:uncharacterized protein YndB with AHSA1/START domain